jgi:cell wall assembly regulator SMI1
VIEEVLWEHAHSRYQSLRPPASDPDVELLKRTLPVAVPKALEQSLRIHDGMAESIGTRPVDLVDGWVLLPAESIVQEWQMMWHLQCDCEFGGDKWTTTLALKNDMHWRAGWIPVLNENGNKIVIDMDPGPEGQAGQVFRWFNYGEAPMRVLAKDWRVWLDTMAEELVTRRFQLMEYGGILLTNEEII